LHTYEDSGVHSAAYFFAVMAIEPPSGSK